MEHGTRGRGTALVGCAALLTVALAGGVAARPTRASTTSRDPVVNSGAKQDLDDAWITLRVTDAVGSLATVDRGTRDGLRVGARVILTPLEGGAVEAEVVSVQERTANVRPLTSGWQPVLGTRGEAWVPAELLKPVPAKRPTQPLGQETQSLPWENRDETWQPGMPLLADVEILRPEQRPMTWTGRAYSVGNWDWTTEDGRSDGFLRVGTGVEVENPFGTGGSMLFDGELNTRFVERPDSDELSLDKLRLDRLSYRRGGTRFSKLGWEAGRFLQRGLPEFGALDGAEWVWRTDSSNRFGFSSGFLPTPDQDMSSFTDGQLAGYYQWNDGPQERFSATLGYQKTWHDGVPDRDVIATRFHFLPVDGWRFFGNVLFDYYTENEQTKDSGVEVSQLVMNAGQRWKSGTTLDFTLTHRRPVDMLRYEGLPLDPDQLQNDHDSQLIGTTRMPAGRDRTFVGMLGVWADAEDAGGVGEAGIEQRDWLAHDSRADLSFRYVQGKFVTVGGMRAGYGAPLPGGLWGGRWKVLYDFGNNKMKGFASDNDDLLQNRLRGTLDFVMRGGWTLNLYLQGLAWDDTGAVTAGFYLTKSF